MSENKDANDLAKLLDETLGDFEKRKVTDDELDEIMNEHDRTAIQKSAQEFDVMLSKLSEQLQPGNGDSDLLPEVDDPAMMDLFSTMKDAFFAQDMSPMIRATAEKYDGYLAEKGPELSAEQREAYEKQRDQLKVIAEEYAKPEPDPAEMDNRLKEIKKHWEKLQEYGDPPSDLFPMIDSRPPTEAESELPAFVSKDLLYYKHGSSVVVVCLAPNHPALSKVKKVVFSSTHTQKTGTKSHRITKGEKICEIITEDDVHYTPRYEDTGVLLEVNRRLLNEPELINKSPTYEGYLVIFKFELPEVPDRSTINDKDLEKFGVSDEQRLFRHILRSYDTSVRPVFNASKIVNVFMGLTLTHIFNIDERNQVLALNVWVEQCWNDERIRWEPSEYGNISKLTVGANYVWRPDIVLYNNARDFSRGFVDTNLHITNDGFVQWAPPAKVHSICRMQTEFFPFDDQHCALEFGSWIYDSSQMDLQILERYDGKAPFTIDSFTENGEWEIVANRTRKLLRGRNSIYPTVVFELHLRRRMLYFLYNIIVPCIMLSILTITQFILPCESCEKITLGLTVLLAYSVFSFNIAENMPETSDAVPLIAIYLMAIMAISGLSVCFSVGVLNMRHGADSKYRIPFILDFIGFKILAKIFGGDKSGTTEVSSNGKLETKDLLKDLLDYNNANPAKEEKPPEDAVHRWNQLSNIFDRFFFCLVSLMTLSTTVTLLLVCPRFSERTLDIN